MWCVSENQTNLGANKIYTGDMIIVEFIKCYNTSRKDCMNKTTIDQTVADSKSVALFLDFVYDANNYESPIQYVTTT